MTIHRLSLRSFLAISSDVTLAKVEPRNYRSMTYEDDIVKDGNLIKNVPTRHFYEDFLFTKEAEYATLPVDFVGLSLDRGNARVSNHFGCFW